MYLLKSHNVHFMTIYISVASYEYIILKAKHNYLFRYNPIIPVGTWTGDSIVAMILLSEYLTIVIIIVKIYYRVRNI